MPYPTVHSWFHRNSIPKRRQVDIVDAARRRGFSDITLEAIVRAEMEGCPSARERAV